LNRSPKRTPVNRHTEPTPEISAPPTLRVQARVTPDDNPGHARVRTRRSPRGRQPPQVTQEEWAYQSLSTPFPKINRVYAVANVTTGQQLEHRQLLQQPDLKPIWKREFTNEFGRLAQGIRDIKGTDTIVLTPPSDIPKERTKRSSTE
jgi:hypothetical protein